MAPALPLGLTLIGLLAAGPLLAGCLGAEDEGLDAATLAQYPKTPENFLILEEWARVRITPGAVHEFPFTVPADLAFLDLDNHFRVDTGGGVPRVRMTYDTPSGAEVAATSHGGSGVNGVRVDAPDAGHWVLVLDASDSEDAFTARMWLYGCATGTECREPERGADGDAHGH